MSFIFYNKRIVSHRAQPVWIGKNLIRGGSCAKLADDIVSANRVYIDYLVEQGQATLEYINPAPVAASAPELVLEAPPEHLFSDPEPLGEEANNEPPLEELTPDEQDPGRNQWVDEYDGLKPKQLKVLCEERGIPFTKADGREELLAKLRG